MKLIRKSGNWTYVLQLDRHHTPVIAHNNNTLYK